jgi:hypothetical protein
LGSTAYPEDATLFIRGDVLDTIPRIIPERIALLRLDTDWYASTKHEMVHLYPRLVEKGVLIVDDYGYWRGSQKAIDEYFEHKNHRILLCRLDETGRVGLKTMDCSLGSIPGNENLNKSFLKSLLCASMDTSLNHRLPAPEFNPHFLKLECKSGY